jgi:hypothetical protein
MLNKKLYLPLFVVEAYLLFTLWLLFFGPIEWPLENLNSFLTYITLYHLFFISGYVCFVEYYKRNTFFKNNKTNLIAKNSNIESLLIRNYWYIIFFAIVCSVIAHRNITHSSSYFPKDYFITFYNGLKDPALVRGYYASNDYLINFKGNKYVTSIMLFFSVFKYSLLPVLIYLWPKLSRGKKIAGGVALVLPLISGVSISISAINFSYFFIISICFLMMIFNNNVKDIVSEFKKRKFFIFSLIFLFFFSFWHFYSVKSGTSIYKVVVENTVPSSFSYLEEKKIKFKSSHSSSVHRKTFATDFYEKITVYLVQGYQGMSISIGEKFETTYGVGHSVFLQKIFDKYLGLTLGERSFQRKISDRWDEFVYWHSAYSHFANDVSFPGVCVVMLVLGAFLARVYIYAIEVNDFFANLLMPLFGIMFLYLSANNQVFSFLENMSSFWVLTLCFLLLNYYWKKLALKA